MANKERSVITDRGYSWLVMFSSFILHSLYSGNFTAHGIFLPEFVDYFQVSTAEAAVAGSLALGISGIIGIILGPLTKQFGTRVIVMAGGVLSGVGITAASFCGNLQVINILLGVLPGIGTGCYVIGGTVATLEYFDKRRSLAFGIVVTGYSVGSMTSPQIIRLLVREYGWRGAMLIQGSIQFNSLACGALLRPQVNVQEEEEVHEKSSHVLRKLQSVIDFSVLKDVKYVLFISAVSLNTAVQNMPYMFLPARAESTGSSKLEAVTLITVFTACSVAMRPIYGYFGDRLGFKRTLVYAVAGIFCGAVHFGFYFVKSYTLMAIYAATIGSISAAYVTMENAVLGDIVPVTKLPHATGLMLFIIGIIALVAPPIAAMTVDLTGDYATPFLGFGLVQGAGGVCSGIVYLIQRRDEKKQIQNIRAEEQDVANDFVNFLTKRAHYTSVGILGGNYDIWKVRCTTMGYNATLEI